MADIKDRAREYLAKHSEYSEVFGQTFVAVDTLTAMVDFTGHETKTLKTQIADLKEEINKIAFARGELEEELNREKALNKVYEDNNRQLREMIEKMKNWCNCKNYQQCLIELAEQGKGMKPSECCVNCKKWELEDYITRLERRNKKKQEIKEND